MRKGFVLTTVVLISLQAVGAEPAWTPVALDKELYPIAHLESSFGKNMSHQPHSRGPFYSSYGALGLKAATAYEAYLMSPKTQTWANVNSIGALLSTEKFFSAFISHDEFYNRLANVHWWYLRKNTGSIEQAVYAWRHGLAAAQRTKSEEINADTYVSAYVTRSAASNDSKR
jgi:hypothetical protein